MIELKSIHKQQYHHYSAINIKKNNIRKPLWYWYKNNNLNEIEIPDKPVSVIDLEYLGESSISLKKYIDSVDDRLCKITDSNFSLPTIQNSWLNFNKISEIILLKYRIRVSSGFYIRMIAKDLKKKGIACHIFDINRTKIFEKK